MPDAQLRYSRRFRAGSFLPSACLAHGKNQDASNPHQQRRFRIAYFCRVIVFFLPQSRMICTCFFSNRNFSGKQKRNFSFSQTRVCAQTHTRIERSSAGGEMQRRRRERGSETAGAFDEAAVRCQICLRCYLTIG